MTTSPGNQHIQWHDGSMSRQKRLETLGLQGATLWFTGLSGSGKSTVAVALEKVLTASRIPSYRLDGDNLRHGINSDLGFSEMDRKENIRRVGEISRLFSDAGMLCLVSMISPFKEERHFVRSLHISEGLPFVEVFVDAPLPICEKRDPKGLYQKARAGEIPNFTGLGSPYEPPDNPEIWLDTQNKSAEQCAMECMDYIHATGLLRS